ncbi:ABC-type multidrug transport system fused ATPase/permease subunit [Paenibacillus anaericanus]|uniref:ABC transporter ATP-binding protein n=1 Tax=Paenibacillus anaericanus TaxID=170367 RepID=A0A433Y4L9_9BACL|nr:ABC transporter ATP-binding protein [Paenibacillus anaericanus]MDQ0089907.1 ABC-type multidrug transport system fused ATPase/permease subunit [Paenibacillus anaericanus]RUT43005.1 ABC transporter ATP-binding protein [Paenibacillus anaericanus]
MNDRKTLNKIINLFIPFKRKICITMVLLSLASLVNLFLPLTTRKIIDEGFIQNNMRTVIFFSLISFGLIVVGKSMEIMCEEIRTNIYIKIKLSLNEHAFHHLSRLKIKYFKEANTTVLLSNIKLDVDNITKVVDSNFFFLLTQILSLLGGLVGLLIIDWRLTILVICFTPAKYISAKYFSKKRENLIEKFIQSSSDYASWFGDTIGGINEIRLFGLIKNKKEEFTNKQLSMIGTEKRMEMLNVYSLAVESILLQLLLVGLYILGASMVFNYTLTVGSIFAFIMYSSYVTSPIASILNIRYFMSNVLPSARRYFNFLDLEVEDSTSKLVPKALTQMMKGNIEYSNVNFSYSEEMVLKNINFVIHAKEKVAIVGHNGSGKSTLIELLLRFHTPSSGTIKMDGVDIEQYDIDEYRQQISVVSQHVYLFDTTIENNIKLYSEPEYNEMQKVLIDAQLTEFALGESEDNDVGCNGLKMSGGQRQKIALARALIHEKELFIFDEATSNLDTESEIYINHLLNNRLKDKTVILVTHQMEVLKHVDRVIVIRDGELEYIGEYDQLFTNSSYFRDMVLVR